MATYEFGSYAYEDHGYITDHPEAPAAKLRTAEPAGVPGLYTGGGLRAAMRMSITGVLIATGVEDLIELWRDLVAAHEPGVPQALYLEDADRFLMAEVESGPVEITHNPPLKGAKAFEIGFLVASPYWLALADTNAALAHGGGSTVVTPAGRTYSLPRITLVVSAADGSDSITVENATTGESIVLTPANGATGTYVIDCETKSISKDTVTPIYAYDGEFMRLLAAANTVDITLSGAGVTLSSATITWRDRD